MEPYQIALIIIFSCLVAILILEEVIVEIVMHKTFNHRGDGCLRFGYTMPSDFPNLNRKKIYIKSKKNTLVGFEYKDKDIKNYKAVIMFAHGIGSGHEYILTLLNKLCQDGYIVVAYDQAGSMRSTGARVKDLSQCLGDAERVYNWINAQEEYKQYDLYVMGHSWGGFTALNALNIHHNRVKKCIAIAGFNSHIDASLGASPAYKVLAPGIVLYDLIHHGKYAFWSSSKALKHTKAEVLCLHGEYDTMVPLKDSYDKYKKISQKRSNIHMKYYEGKAHHVFLLRESELKQGELSNGLGLLGQGEPAYDLYNDYQKTYHVDDNVVRDMLEFLNK